MLDLATMAWVDRNEDLVLIGQSGVGKSHIAKALCLVGCQQQRTVRYTTCADLLATLYAALADNSLGHTAEIRAYADEFYNSDAAGNTFEPGEGSPVTFGFLQLKADLEWLRDTWVADFDDPTQVVVSGTPMAWCGRAWRWG